MFLWLGDKLIRSIFYKHQHTSCPFTSTSVASVIAAEVTNQTPQCDGLNKHSPNAGDIDEILQLQAQFKVMRGGYRKCAPSVVGFLKL